MFTLNPLEVVSGLFIGIGLLLFLYAYRAAIEDEYPATGSSSTAPLASETQNETERINAAFAAAIHRGAPREIDTLEEVPINYVRPGDLMKTVKIPIFVQTFKFREKRTLQTQANT